MSNGYSTIMQQQASGLSTNPIGTMTSTRISPTSNVCGNLQFDSPGLQHGLMFNSANGTMTFSGGPPTVGVSPGNNQYTQLLPQIHPMNAVPISVSALSHGPPHMSHTEKLLSSPVGTNEMFKNQNAFASFSPPPGVVSHQHGKQNAHQHQQLQNVYQPRVNMQTSSPRLSHPARQQLTTEIRRQDERTKIPQQLLSTSKSIVSLGSKNADSQTFNPDLLSNHSSQSAQNITQQTVAHQTTTSVLTVTKEDILEQLEQPMYSSACNATMKAQHKLKLNRDTQIKNYGNAHIKIENDENDTKDKTNDSLLAAEKTKAISSSTSPRTNSASVPYDAPIQTSMKRKLSFGEPLSNNNSALNAPGESKHKCFHETKTESMPLISPHAFLHKLLKSRGYSTTHYCSLEGGYYCRPTALQCASYGTRVVNAVRNSDKKLFADLLSAGLSRNPCNKFGESILHMVCRRGDYDILKLLMDEGAEVQVSDDFGRTPMHDACWTIKPCFKSIKMILEKDIRLLHIVDCRGSPPLEYVKRESWREWNDFFDQQKEVFWPQRSLDEDNAEAPPPLVNVPPHSKPIADPENCTSVEQAAMFANGKNEPLYPA